jgi:hypothetical protein
MIDNLPEIKGCKGSPAFSGTFYKIVERFY